ncbi:MAG: Mg2+/Co2+ transporter [Phycisphaera sp.]|nr:Mg2+/Co2+ transporter [Phycisphaera sp.]
MPAPPSRSIDDDGGLICGFRLHKDAPATAIRLSDLGANPCLGSDRIWLHFNGGDMRATKWIESCEALPESAREFLLSNDRHVGIDSLEDGLIATLGDLSHELDASPERMSLLRLYADASVMISVRHHPLRGIDLLRRAVMKGKIIESPVELVAHLMHHLADIFAGVIAELGEDVDETEERLLTGAMIEEGRMLAKARPFLARLRRHLFTPRTLDVDRLLEDWCNEDDVASLKRGINRLDAVAQDLELVQYRARLVQEEIASRLTEATNRNMMFLSVVTTLFLPITLISGIFGMNVTLPVDPEHGFAIVTLLMAATFFVSYLVLKWRKMV